MMSTFATISHVFGYLTGAFRLLIIIHVFELRDLILYFRLFHLYLFLAFIWIIFSLISLFSPLFENFEVLLFLFYSTYLRYNLGTQIVFI